MRWGGWTGEGDRLPNMASIIPGVATTRIAWVTDVIVVAIDAEKVCKNRR